MDAHQFPHPNTGKLLASGGDRGSVLVWCEPENAAEPKAAFGDDPDDKPTKWRIKQNYKYVFEKCIQLCEKCIHTQCCHGLTLCF